MCWYTAYCRFAVYRILQFSFHVEFAFCSKKSELEMLNYLFWSAIVISILQICGVTQSADFPNATEILDPDIELTSHQKLDATKKGLKMNPWLLAKYI